MKEYIIIDKYENNEPDTKSELEWMELIHEVFEVDCEDCRRVRKIEAEITPPVRWSNLIMDGD